MALDHGTARLLVESPVEPLVESDAAHGSMEGLETARGGVFTFLTCGSVDDGKSTLIGRFLWDTGSITTDQQANLERSPRAAGGEIDFSLLVDGLVAEREQGITIDIAWRYVDAVSGGDLGRRLVIIDSPGHEQYTRNMASGASHADAAILLVDARHGIKPQTRRHAAIAGLVGVRHIILAVNKMDLVDWSEARFRAIEAEFRDLHERFAFASASAIPVAALLGDNVTRRSPSMPWYWGRTLLETLSTLPSRSDIPGAPFRLPVQTTLRAGTDFRGFAGSIASGTLRVGDTVLEAVSGRTARVTRILTPAGERGEAGAGAAITVTLDSDIDISRGSVLAGTVQPPIAARHIEARLVWLGDTGFDRSAGYLLRTATDLVSLADLTIVAEIDLTSLAEQPADGARMNSIVRSQLTPSRPVAVDPFSHVPGTGCVAIIDAVSGNTVAAGTIVDANAEVSAKIGTFVLTRALLLAGVAADLHAGAASEAELRRRANEIALLMSAAGVPVRVEL